MGLWELLLTAVGLSMDAFAVSVCKGLAMKRMRYGQAVVIGLYFGIFQAVMPLIGWLLGTSFSRYIEAFDHWIAFVLLAFIGGKMLWDAFHEETGSADAAEQKLNHKEMFMLAIATSIDALAVGIAFACLDVPVVRSVCRCLDWKPFWKPVSEVCRNCRRCCVDPDWCQDFGGTSAARLRHFNFRLFWIKTVKLCLTHLESKPFSQFYFRIIQYSPYNF